MNVLGRSGVAVFVSLVLLGTVVKAGPPGSGYHLVKSVPIGRLCSAYRLREKGASMVSFIRDRHPKGLGFCLVTSAA
jgi:hypothetical protein